MPMFYSLFFYLEKLYRKFNSETSESEGKEEMRRNKLISKE